MYTYENPTEQAAARILEEAPAIQHIVRNHRWIDNDGWVDWGAVNTFATEMDFLSGGEKSLIRFALTLHMADASGLDGRNLAVVAAALNGAATRLAEQAEQLMELEGRLTPGTPSS